MFAGWLTWVVSLLASAIMILGSVGGYIPQYLTIAKTNKAEGFSMLVSLALITANTIRVYFWFAQPFDTTLLIQAYAVVFFQLALVHVCTRARLAQRMARAKKPERLRRFTDFQLEDFWAWDDFPSYVYCFLSFNVVLVVACVSLMHRPWFADALGMLALGVEAMLAVPQAVRNYRKQSVDGLSKAMVISWALGDTYKIVYYLVSGVPFQFLWCGLVQFSTDTFILFQIYFLYSAGSHSRRGTVGHVSNSRDLPQQVDMLSQ